jgi:hypothetical protein
MIYLHEMHRVRQGRMSGLFEAVEHDYLPIARRHGIRLVGYWQVPPGHGSWPTAVGVWELDDFAHYTTLMSRMYGETDHDPDLVRWHEGMAEWVESSEGMVCYPSKLTPTVAQIEERGVKAKLCTHELIHCEPARQLEYLELCEEMWWRRVAEPSGRSLIGLYWSPWKNTRAICIWGQGAEWEDVTPMGKGESWLHDVDHRIWQSLGLEIRKDWDDRFLVPAPFSTIR